MHTFCQRSVVRRERGVVLYVALVVMVIMMLAGVAVLRSVGTGQGVAGNLSFKQNATSAGDLGVTTAAGYLAPANAALTPSAATLSVDLPAQGYFASWNAFDPTTFAWDTDPSVIIATADDGTGNEVRYVIHRLCSNAGPIAPPNVCVSVVGPLGTGGGGAGGTGIGPPPPPPYFRVTTRVKGPRNTVSYTQVVMK